ncbi:hypothetical protein JMG10_23010 [Nostoc ellipsosporum NOK]|uniref:hypothetical protein n=1 Tax=Sphingomonas sp. IBVSS2 TaxID=1985172 RepID=UPI0011819771|nr:hypothetical protein [Sphingomonas sp. IBVSS2]MDF2384360.1 hypothetical protein [Nostoc ellipsosporum NOK]
MFTKLLTAAAIASMATAPVLAAPTSASKLSLSGVRAATVSKKKSDLAPAVLIGVLATVAIIGGAVILADSDDKPDSP